MDVLKVLQFLPGVSSAGEGNSGFYVRGGGPDQNLILLDDATVYNASHLFGFFSVFNADAIKNIDLLKGSMPAEYGGRVSSVLNIGLKEGNAKKWKTTGGLGLISSRLTVEGPIIKDTCSLILSGRRTYLDVLTRPFIKGSAFEGTGYFFYDFNAKINYRLSDRDQLFLSGYFGKDVFSFNSEEAGFNTSIPWGNSMGSLRWNRILNDRMFLNVGATYSEYTFSFLAGQEEFEFGFESGIKDLAGRTEWSFYPNPRHVINGGIDYVHQDFIPTDFTARSGDTEFDTGTSSRRSATREACTCKTTSTSPKRSACTPAYGGVDFGTWGRLRGTPWTRLASRRSQSRSMHRVSWFNFTAAGSHAWPCG